MEGDSVVRVVSRGLFETTITKCKGFVGSFWDLKHDAGKKFDLGPVLDENGILWTKCGFPEGVKGGSYYAAPCEKIELIESGPARVRIRTSGPHCRYGRTDPPADWKEFRFEQTFTMYPTGATYIDYKLTANEGEAVMNDEADFGSGGFNESVVARMDKLGIEAVYRHTSDRKSPPPLEAMLEFFRKHLLRPEK